jgi:hypothetical protein
MNSSLQQLPLVTRVPHCLLNHQTLESEPDHWPPQSTQNWSHCSPQRMGFTLITHTSWSSLPLSERSHLPASDFLPLQTQTLLRRETTATWMLCKFSLTTEMSQCQPCCFHVVWGWQICRQLGRTHPDLSHLHASRVPHALMPCVTCHFIKNYNWPKALTENMQNISEVHKVQLFFFPSVLGMEPRASHFRQALHHWTTSHSKAQTLSIIIYSRTNLGYNTYIHKLPV